MKTVQKPVPGIGIYPGTFDPVHNGHIAFALAALDAGALERVVFLPERHPRDKQNVTAFEHRVAMLRLATQDHSNLSVDALPDRQFTVAQTLPRLQEQYGDGLAFLLGSDVVHTFLHRWPGLDDLLDAVELIVALRKQDTKAQVAGILRQLDRPVRYTILASPQLHLASTHVRGGRHQDIPPNVQAYIAQHGLYGAGLF